jgi:flavin-dependent dehydrogenase
MGVLKRYDVIIVGGGLAGLTCALHLSRKNCSVLLLEKYTYPHHKVCGEYISKEVLPYLNSLGIDPFTEGAKRITNFEVSDRSGKVIRSKLPLGGFGLSRYTFDNLLYEAVKKNAEVIFQTVESVTFEKDLFKVKTQSKQEYNGSYVIGAFGKRSNLDIFLKRKFVKQASPWLAVKAHYNYDFPDDTVALHNFEGGYCGLSKIESNAVNACYLTTYKSFKRFDNIPDFQKNILIQNPHLKHFFEQATPLFKKPLTISQISFEQKSPVENHVFMIGDSAGLIHPLCGNGMAMAIHSAKIFSETFLKAFVKGTINREELECLYAQFWDENFSKRLKTGRRIQEILLRPVATRLGFKVAKIFPSIVPSLIKKTHGAPLI